MSENIEEKEANEVKSEATPEQNTASTGNDEAKVAELNDKYLRLYSDFDNYRNQVELKKKALKQEPGIFEESLNRFFSFINLVIERKNQFIDLIKRSVSLFKMLNYCISVVMLHEMFHFGIQLA